MLTVSLLIGLDFEFLLKNKLRSKKGPIRETGFFELAALILRINAEF